MNNEFIIILTLTIRHVYTLSCWHNSCPFGENYCLLVCPAHERVCTSTFQRNTAGSLITQYFGCFQGEGLQCDNTRCEYHITEATGVHTCCCDHDGCNGPGDLIPNSGMYTPYNPPSPTVTPPPTLPDHVTCEVYGDNIPHSYKQCDGHCGATYRLNGDNNYFLYSLFCRDDKGPGPARCVLDTSGNNVSLTCTCTQPLCNSIESIQFTDPTSVIDYIDTVCRDDLQCSHVCIRPAGGGAPFCICRHGYISANDGRSCIDLDECQRNQHTCSHTCVNNDGGYNCTCPINMYLLEDNRTCQESVFTCFTNPNCNISDGSCSSDVQHCELIGESTINTCLVIYRYTDGWIPLSAGCAYPDPPCDIDTCVLHPSSNNPKFYLCCCVSSFCNHRGSTIFPSVISDTTNTTMATSIPTSIITTNTTFSIINTENTNSPFTKDGLPILLSCIVMCIVIVGIFLCIYQCRRLRRQKREELPLNLSCDEVYINTVTYNSADRIGSGRFSDVYRGSGHYSSLAVKVFKPTGRDSWAREIEIYKLIRHPNILTYKGSIEHPKMSISTKYHSRGSLLKVLTGNILNFDDFINMSYGFAKGLEYLHSESDTKPAIAHRDIKSSNILVNSHMECVISDFGLAVKLSLNDVDFSGVGQVGTPRYMAPEIINGVIDFSTNLSLLRTDNYSCGLVIWEMLSRTCPEHGVLDEVQKYRPPYDEFWGNFEGTCHPTIEDMKVLLVTERKRPSIPHHFKTKPEYDRIVSTIEESWCDEGDSRITATCICERLEEIKRKDDSGVSSSDDPATLPPPPPPHYNDIHNETTETTV